MAKTQDIISLIKEATDGILSEDSLNAIETAFTEAVNDKSSLSTEAALIKQDAEYADKLKKLLEAVDKDRASKLIRVVETLDANNAAKLKKVVNRYKSAIFSEAKQYKKSLVRSISKYLEQYLEQAIPQNFINEAVRERKAQSILENLRQHLAIDSALMKESVRNAVVDGKKQINEAQTELEKAQQKIKLLEKSLDSAKAEVVFAEKVQNLPQKKRDYVRKVLAGKSSQFITENIDYTINLFEKAEGQQVDFLREQALQSAIATDDAPSLEEAAVVVESVQDTGSAYVKNTYLTELSHY